jgi:hypothetical protein
MVCIFSFDKSGVVDDVVGSLPNANPQSLSLSALFTRLTPANTSHVITKSLPEEFVF